MRIMIGFLVQGRVRIKIRIRVGVMFNVSIYHLGAIVAGANDVHSMYRPTSLLDENSQNEASYLYTTNLPNFEKKKLKEHCTQKKIWIHLMQNIFRNQTVKNLTILDNPFKRYDFSKFSLYSVKSLCRPHKLATVPCHGCTTPHWFCTQIITNFQFSWI